MLIKPLINSSVSILSMGLEERRELDILWHLLRPFKIIYIKQKFYSCRDSLEILLQNFLLYNRQII